MSLDAPDFRCGLTLRSDFACRHGTGAVRGRRARRPDQPGARRGGEKGPERHEGRLLGVLCGEVPQQPARGAGHVPRGRDAAHALPQLPRHGEQLRHRLVHCLARAGAHQRRLCLSCGGEPRRARRQRGVAHGHDAPERRRLQRALRGAAAAQRVRDAEELPGLHRQLPRQFGEQPHAAGGHGRAPQRRPHQAHPGGGGGGQDAGG
eukprot:1242782-Pyramimonas_sp.AAC.2